MRLSVLGSSSSGNGYILQNESEAIVIECGCPLLDCEKKIDFNLRKISGVLITHEHKDHAKYAKQYASNGLKLFATEGTILKIGGYGIVPLQLAKIHHIGKFNVYPFPVTHDAEQPCGFIIDCPDGNRIVFATDTQHLNYIIKDVSYFMIECNYEDEVLEKNTKKGIVNISVADRVRLSHMSLRRCLQTLKNNRLNNVKGIILLHLSKDNSRGETMKQQIQIKTGKMVYIAKKNFEIELL